MTGKTHQILGLSCGLTYFLVAANSSYAPATLAAVLVASHLAALIPDIDEHSALIWEKIPLGHALGHVSDPFLKHRNLTHTFLSVVIFLFAAKYLIGVFPAYWNIDKNILLVSSVIAYSSHIFADMFTAEGVPLFFPIKKMIGIPPKPFQGVRIQTGKWFENLIIFPVLNLYLVVIIINYWDKIKIALFK